MWKVLCGLLCGCVLCGLSCGYHAAQIITHTHSSTQNKAITSHTDDYGIITRVSIELVDNSAINALIISDIRHHLQAHKTIPSATYYYNLKTSIIYQDNTSVLVLMDVYIARAGWFRHIRQNILYNKKNQTKVPVSDAFLNGYEGIIQDRYHHSKKRPLPPKYAIDFVQQWLRIVAPVVAGLTDDSVVIPRKVVSHITKPQMFLSLKQQWYKKNHKNIDCTKVGCVALTFDDGPRKYTEKLLNILHLYGVKSTFFVLWHRVEENPQLLVRESYDGHEIGNHSRDHPNFKSIPMSEVESQIKKTDDVIDLHTQKRPQIIRTPYGLQNREHVEKFAKSFIGWNNDSRDRRHRDSQKIITNLDKIRPGQIILFHDIYDQSARAIPHIIEKIHQKWYHLLTVSELIPHMKPHTIYRSQ